uniref:Uncharacterized protein n=1 Tax=Setaria italica TaxID=4555 RepID=K3ZBE3_SETIT
MLPISYGKLKNNILKQVMFLKDGEAAYLLWEVNKQQINIGNEKILHLSKQHWFAVTDLSKHGINTTSSSSSLENMCR